MRRITELFVEKSTSIQALGNVAQIALESLRIAISEPSSHIGQLYQDTSSRLPNHYLNGRSINDPRYKVVSFIDSQCLVSMISEVEAFIQESLITVLCKYPEEINKVTLEIKKLRELGNVEAAVLYAAHKHINEVMYKRPNEYKKELLSILSAREVLLDDVWSTYVEAKARRDIGVHNSWVANDIYAAKVREVGLEPASGEISVDVKYFLSAMAAGVELMKRIANHCEDTFA